MMKKVYKYILPMMERVEIEMPEVNKVLKAELQEGFICIWALVDTESPVVLKQFAMYKTGQEVKLGLDELNYLGEAIVHVGMDLGFHVFEVIKPKSDYLVKPAGSSEFVPEHISDNTYYTLKESDLRVGSIVSHERFGRGVVVDLMDAGRPTDWIVTINFIPTGSKRLILKFAKLRLESYDS